MLERLNNFLKQALQHFTLRWARKKRGVVWTGQRNVPFFDQKGRLIDVNGMAGDITRHRSAEEALEKSWDFYLTLFEELPVMIWRSGIDAKRNYFNRSWLEFTGRSMEEEAGYGWARGVHPEDLGRCLTTYLEAFREIEPFETEYRLGRKDGEYRWIVDIGRPFYDPEGNFCGYIGSCYDITDRKNYEHALRLSEEKFCKVFNSSPNPMSITTFEDGRYVDVNDALVAASGYSREEMIGRTSCDLNLWIDPEVKESMVRILREGISVKNLEVHFRTRNGQIHYGLLSVEIVEIGGKKYMLGSFNNLADLKKAHEALRQSEAFYRMLAENMVDVIWTEKLEPNFSFSYISPSVMRLTGYTPDEIMSLPIERILSAASYIKICSIRSYLLSLAADFSVFPAEQAEIELVRKDKSQIWVEVQVKLITSADSERYILGIARDITYRKRAEDTERVNQEQLRSLVAELSLAEERERKRIAGDIHDYITQYLAVTKMKLGLLRKKIDQAEIAEQVEGIRQLLDETIKHSRSLINELSPPVLHEMGFTAAAKWLGEEICRNHGIEFEFEYRGREVPADNPIGVILLRSIRELLVNTVKHASAERVRLTVQSRGGLVRVEVQDDGTGFKDVELAYRYKDSGGFGLFSIRERLDHLGGVMTVHTGPGEGTRVVLEVPLEKKGD